MAEKKFSFTPGQQQAIDARGSSVLVSAAAGSGKTRVLVERLMAQICDEGRDIDRFLVITYTNAAAAELKGRILKELSGRSSGNPGNRHLRRQASLSSRAKISTIHKFCFDLLRERGQEIGVSADFTLLDNERGSQLREQCLDRILEKAYDSINEDQGFALLADMVGAGRDDSAMISSILELHGKMLSHPYPAKWAQAQIEALDSGDEPDLSATVWGRELMSSAEKSALYWEKRLASAFASLENEGEAGAVIMEKYGPSITETLAGLREFASALDKSWDEAQIASEIPFPRFAGIRNCPDTELQDWIKGIREQCKKACEGFKKDFFAPSAELMSDLRHTAPAMKSLLGLGIELYDEFRREKSRRGVMDFSDAEHCALELLVDGETGEPTQTAIAVSERFTEIMVDEYQDVNSVQEMIFTAISNGGKNLFMVGDVKQSIYSFRLANPRIFLGKLSGYPDCGIAGEGEPRRVLLRENFRSRACVLEASNHLFKNIMSPELGEIEYDDSARLIPGAVYPPEGEAPVDVDIISIPPSSEDGARPDKTLLEARHAAARIKAIRGRMLIGPAGGQRPIDYGDIAVLLRSPGNQSAAWCRAFEEAGIPLAAQQSGGFFESTEIQDVMSILRIIDNPRQDVALISALSSPLFGFSPDELAEIRASRPSSDFYDALVASVAESDKTRAFLASLNQFRDEARDCTVSELLWTIYSRTDYLAIASAMDGGKLRRENLMSLFQYAADFEQSGYRGLFQFIRYLDRAAAGENPSPGGDITSRGGAVKLMSIHKSKGLEFPLVFLSGCGGQFYKSDAYSGLLIHADLGLGARITDTDRGISYPTIAHRAISRKIISEKLSEEIRVLYVAMTRARERLIITSCVKNPGDFVEKLKISAESPVSPQILESCSSFIHWIALAAQCPGGGEFFRLNAMDGEDIQGEHHEDRAAEAPSDTESVSDILPPSADEIARRLNFLYPWQSATELPSKLTATEMKGRSLDGDLSDEAFSPVTLPLPLEPRLPDFSPRSQKLGPAAKGTALHLAMQHLDYSRAGSTAEIESEISRLCVQGFLSKQQAEAVDIKSILDFFSSSTGVRLLKGKNLLREFKFSLLQEAGKHFQGGGEDRVLLQGVVDCCFEEDGLTVLDFKTDFVTAETVSQRARTYENQVRIYAQALERILGKPVRRGILYFFRLQSPVEIELPASC